MKYFTCLFLAVSACFGGEFKPLFNEDLSNAIFPEGVWTRDAKGVITASEDKIIWTDGEFDDFVLRLEFNNGEAANSGVFLYGSNIEEWVTDSIEVQIADDYAEKWKKMARSWQCGAFFGRQGATKQVVKKPGEWNQMIIVATGPMIAVYLNGERVNAFDLRDFTSARNNPDGSVAPRWLKKAPADLPLKGKIGFQGKHGGAPIYMRNIEILEL